MKDIIQWLAETGTNDILTDIWKHNWILITFFGSIIGAFLKGRAKDFWAKLSTALPFSGDPKRHLP